MSNIIDRQTFIFSVNLGIINSEVMKTPMNLRFAADELILKSISYNPDSARADTSSVVQIWCNITNDNLIATFPNNVAVFQQHNESFRISNNFQTGVFELQFQETDNNTGPIYYNPQPFVSNGTRGVIAITIEFVKYAK